MTNKERIEKLNESIKLAFDVSVDLVTNREEFGEAMTARMMERISVAADCLQWVVDEIKGYEEY